MELVHGNRGKCAQPCRLPYELIKSTSLTNVENNLVQNENTTHNTISNTQSILDKGYLLSTKDLCSLDFLPTLVNLGIKSFKIEGRLKNPEYVATVTKIYRKYIDLALSNNPYIVEDKDKKDLLQVFNRGGFSSGYLENEPNQNLIYKNKPNNIGIFLGTVHNYNPNKGYITLKLDYDLSIGDSVSLEKEHGLYTISELMINNKNVQSAHKDDIVKIGRIKGNISVNHKIFKISSKEMKNNITNLINSENIKTKLNCKLTIKKDMPISMNINTSKLSTDITNTIYDNINFTITSDLIPVEALNSPITETRIIEQINKLGGTPYEFEKIDIDLDDNLYIPSISKLNQLRRDCIEKLHEILINKIHRNIPTTTLNKLNLNSSTLNEANLGNEYSEKNVSILLNILNPNFDYTKLENINKIYIPLKYFCIDEFQKVLTTITKKFNTYIYMPSIMKQSVLENFNKNINNILNTYLIKGFVISNISHIYMITNLPTINNNYELIANYNMNIYNNHTISELENLKISGITISPELDKNSLNSINSNVYKEAIIYGNLPVMTINYCLLSKSNSCLTNCNSNCQTNNINYYLKDRMNMNFRIIPDSFSKTTTIYNSKITSISASELNINSIRLDFLNENINEINSIITSAKNNEIIEGKEYTNGNLNRIV